MKVLLFLTSKRRSILLYLLLANLSILVLTSPNFAAVEPLTHQLFAGQNIDVGTVSVWNDDEHLYVKYVTTDGWHLAETHMHFATSLDGIPQTKKGNPIPGQFDFKTEHHPKVMEFMYEGDLNGLQPGDMLYFACQADVELLDQDGNTIQQEGAWAGNQEFPGKDWAKYFIYEVQAGDNVPPTIDITNPLDNSVITDLGPYITIKFSDDDTGLNLSSLQIMINDEDYTGHFTVSETSAKYRMIDLLSIGNHVISASISDNAGNTTTTTCSFATTTSTEPVRYIFSVKNNHWIYASPGDGTCREYLNNEDLGILDSSDLVALSRVLPDGKIYFALYDQDGIKQSPADGSIEMYFDNAQMGLGTNDQVFAGHIGIDGSAYFAAEENPDIWQSTGDYTNSFFKQSAQLGIADDDQIKCLHIGYDGQIYFCHSEGQGILQSIADGTNSQFLTSADLGISGSEIDAFAILPETTRPQLSITHPVDGAFVNTTTPNFTVAFSDTESGIDTDTFLAELDGADVSSLFTVTESGASYQVATGDDLSVDSHTLNVSIQDRVGNQSDATSNFSAGTLRAIPSATPTSGTAPLTVVFSTDGEDPTGTIEVFRWDFDGNGSWDTYDTVARDYTRTYSNPGTYSAVLYVQSSTGETATASIVITVENNPPVASADVLPSNGEVPLTVQMTGTGSDVDGTIVLYEWDYEGDGVFDWSSTTSGNTSYTYTTVGTFNAVFRVTDDSGLTDTARATTTVVRTGPPGSPTATSSVSPTSGDAPLNVTFSGSATDPNNDVVLYEWDFDNDGTYDYSSTTSGNTSHTYTEAGTHVATFRVTDSTGLTGIDQLLITVNIQANLSIQNDTVGFLEENFVNFCQLEGVTINVSSIISSSYPSANAIDENSETYWISAYGDTPNQGASPFIEVIFPSAQNISEIIVEGGTYWIYYGITRAKIDLYDSSDSQIYSLEVDLSHYEEIHLPNIANIIKARVTALAANNYYQHVSIGELKIGYFPDTQQEATGTNINTSISAGSPVTIYIKDQYGNTVRTLVNNEYRDLGSFSDYWDCRDDAGVLVHDGVYHAVMQYVVDGQVRTLDLTGTTGGTRYDFPISTGCNTRSGIWTETFSPFDDEQVAFEFTLCSAQEVTFFIGPLWTGTDQARVRTILNRQPFPAGTHTIYWDGLDDVGNIAVAPAGDDLITGAWRYSLPNNAMFMTGGNPVVSNVSADPNYFSPFSEKCDESGNGEGVLVGYTVSEDVASVDLRVYSVETGSLLRILGIGNVSAGDNVIFWDGKNNNGEYVDIGDYRIGVTATDSGGNASMFRYTLVRIDY